MRMRVCNNTPLVRAHTHTHTHTQDQEVFMDTINTPTIRKKIKKLESMEPKESRRIWQHVTEALGNKDVEAATDAKHTVSLAVQMYLWMYREV